jgi:hypothetical protein
LTYVKSENEQVARLMVELWDQQQIEDYILKRGEPEELIEELVQRKWEDDIDAMIYP